MPFPKRLLTRRRRRVNSILDVYGGGPDVQPSELLDVLLEFDPLVTLDSEAVCEVGVGVKVRFDAGGKRTVVYNYRGDEVGTTGDVVQLRALLEAAFAEASEARSRIRPEVVK